MSGRECDLSSASSSSSSARTAASCSVLVLVVCVVALVLVLVLRARPRPRLRRCAASTDLLQVAEKLLQVISCFVLCSVGAVPPSTRAPRTPKFNVAGVRQVPREYVTLAINFSELRVPIQPDNIELGGAGGKGGQGSSENATRKKQRNHLQ